MASLNDMWNKLKRWWDKLWNTAADAAIIVPLVVQGIYPLAASDIKGYSNLGFLWYPNYADLMRQLVENKWNAIALPLFGCTKLSDGQENGVPGYWQYASLQPNSSEMVWFWKKVNEFLGECFAHKIAPIIGLLSDNFPGAGDTRFNREWEDSIIAKVKGLLAKYPESRSAYICPVNELGWSNKPAQMNTLRDFCVRVQSANIVPVEHLLWNGMGRMIGAYPDHSWAQEYHPQRDNDYGPDGCLIFNDAPLNIRLSNGMSLLPPAVDYYRRVRAAGRGYMIFLFDFTGNVDVGGIAMMKEVNQ